MATHYNTRIVTDNLVLNLDAGNTKIKNYEGLNLSEGVLNLYILKR